MTEPLFHLYDSREALAQQLAENVAGWLGDAISERGKATLVVSGGSTPKPFFEALKALPLAWDKLTILPADERWVAPDDADSTEALLKAHLLRPEVNYISLAPINADETPAEGAKRIGAALEALDTPFDVVILGMGEDAHTASLFPGHVALMHGMNPHSTALCLPIKDAPKPPPQRVTLGANRFCDAHHLVLHITGAAKQALYEECIESRDYDRYPIAGILQQHIGQPEIYWAP